MLFLKVCEVCSLKPLAFCHSHESELQKAATFFRNGYTSGTVTTPNVNVAQTVISGTMMEGKEVVDVARLYTGSDNEDDVYDISVKSVDGCTPDEGFNLATPVANNNCANILHSAWKQCRLLHLIRTFPSPLCIALADGISR